MFSLVKVMSLFKVWTCGELCEIKCLSVFCLPLQTPWTGTVWTFRSGSSGPSTCTSCRRSAWCFRSWAGGICAPWQKQTSDNAPHSLETCCMLIWTSGDLVRTTGTQGNDPTSTLLLCKLRKADCEANAVWLRVHLRMCVCKLLHDWVSFFCLFFKLQQWRSAAHQRSANPVNSCF